MKDYLIIFADFFRDGPFYKVYQAETAGKAKYACWLQFRDAYDVTFKDFLGLITVNVVKKDGQV